MFSHAAVSYFKMKLVSIRAPELWSIIPTKLGAGTERWGGHRECDSSLVTCIHPYNRTAAPLTLPSTSSEMHLVKCIKGIEPLQGASFLSVQLLELSHHRAQSHPRAMKAVTLTWNAKRTCPISGAKQQTGLVTSTSDLTLLYVILVQNFHRNETGKNNAWILGFSISVYAEASSEF